MALKGYREKICGNEKTKYFMFETAEKGMVVVVGASSTGSGKPGDPANVASVPTPTLVSGNAQALGVLMVDVVDIDLSKFCHRGKLVRHETTVCNPVVISHEGEFLTNMIVSGLDPAVGAAAYYTTGGLLTTDNTQGGPVGNFMGKVDSDGYVVVKVNL